MLEPSNASMGPRSFDRGNANATAATVNADVASMGPRSFDRGNPVVQHYTATPAVASMGPRSFDRGNEMHHDAGTVCGLASMGPRSFDRGNGGVRKVARQIQTVLQWGRGLSTAEMAKGLTIAEAVREASMGPRSFDRGNSPALPTTGRTGRASMGPRSFDRGNLNLPLLYRFLQTSASMGPRSFDRGNYSLVVICTSPDWGFNGAAVFRPRK